MGVSFKVSEKGTRYKPRVAVTDDNGAENGGGNDSSDLVSEVYHMGFYFSGQSYDLF